MSSKGNTKTSISEFGRILFRGLRGGAGSNVLLAGCFNGSRPAVAEDLGPTCGAVSDLAWLHVQGNLGGRGF